MINKNNIQMAIKVLEDELNLNLKEKQEQVRNYQDLCQVIGILKHIVERIDNPKYWEKIDKITTK